MMGSCQSCCCGSDDEESRYNSQPKKRTRSERNKSSKQRCGCYSSSACRCPNDASDDGTSSCGDTTTSDVEMGKMHIKSINQDNNNQQRNNNQQQNRPVPNPTSRRHSVNEIHTRFTLHQFPLHRCPAKLQLFFTTPQFLRMTPEVESLLQWGKKGSWMNMFTGHVASQPPPRYYELQGLSAVPMRFELIQVPKQFMAKHGPDVPAEERGVLQSTYRDIFLSEFGIALSFVQEPIQDILYKNNISATTPSLLSALVYVPFLYKELSLYPKSFLQKTGLRRIILCESLNYSGQVRKAIPVVISNSLYLDVTVEPIYYMQGVLHHEFFHLFDDKILFEMKKPVKNPLLFYNPKDSQSTRRLPLELNQWLLQGGIKAKKIEPIVKQKPIVTPQPLTNENTPHQINENGDIIIDISNLPLESTSSPTPPTQPIVTPPPDPFEPQFDPAVDQFTMFSMNLITEYLFQRQLVFKPTILPTIVQHYIDSKAKYLAKNPGIIPHSTTLATLSDDNTISPTDITKSQSTKNQPKSKSPKTLSPLDPKSITNKLLQMLTQLFQLEPYFFRSFPQVLHLFKHPHYQQQQKKFINSNDQCITYDITPEQQARQNYVDPVDIDYTLVTSVPLINTTPMKFPQPHKNRIDEYLSIPPVFLLRPQYHQKTMLHYESEIKAYNESNNRNNSNSDNKENSQKGNTYDDDECNNNDNANSLHPPTDIINYPQLNVSLHELFHTSLPNYSRGKLYLTYYRTIAVSDYVPQEFNHPFFPHRRFMYNKNNLTLPQTVAAIPDQWIVTTQEEPFTRFSYGFPPLECFQHLFWTQSTSEAIRMNIDPIQAPVTIEPPVWHAPTLPLRQDSVGSDPLWLLLNFKEFRYGPGGGNYRHADASVTLQKDHQGHHGNQDDKKKNNTKKSKSNNNDGRNDNTMVSLSNHNAQSNNSHLDNGDVSDRFADETDCANELDKASVSSRHSISTTNPSDRDSFSILQSQDSFSKTIPASSNSNTAKVNRHGTPNHIKVKSQSQGSDEGEKDDSIGFLNTYSMSAIEEDKAEVFSWLIRHPPAILNSPDQHLRAKGLELWRRLELFCPDVDEHFLKRLIEHKPFKISTDGWQIKNDPRGYTNWQNDASGQVSWIDPTMFMAKMELFEEDEGDVQEKQAIHSALNNTAQSTPNQSSNNENSNQSQDGPAN